MCIGVAVACNGVQMIGGRVAFVPIEAVAGIASVQLEHLPIARHLRDDRRRGDCRASAVAVEDAALRAWSAAEK